MSIYVVKLSEFFQPEDDIFEMAYFLANTMNCTACGKKCRWKKALARHSMPYGGCSEIRCSDKCVKSNKKYELDKRQLRTINRRFNGIMKKALKQLC